MGGHCGLVVCAVAGLLRLRAACKANRYSSPPTECAAPQVPSGTVGKEDRLVFVWLYRLAPTVLLKIVQSETVTARVPLPHLITLRDVEIIQTLLVATVHQRSNQCARGTGIGGAFA